MHNFRNAEELNPSLHEYTSAVSMAAYNTEYDIDESFAKGKIYKIAYPNGIIISLTKLRFLEPFTRIRKDPEDYICLSYTESGDYYFREEKGTRYVNNHGVYLFQNNKRTIKEVYGTKEPIYAVGVIILNPFFETFLNGRFGINSKALFDRAQNAYRHNYNTPAISLIFKQIEQRIISGMESRIYYESKVLEIFSLIFENMTPTSQEYSNLHISRVDKNALKRAALLLEESMAEPPSISELAQQVNMSASKFKIYFKSLFGATPYGFLRDVQMKHALAHLCADDMNIGEIAQHIGFKSASKFSEAFKSTYGIAPRDYKSSLK